jgi:haloacetate dehalogenase
VERPEVVTRAAVLDIVPLPYSMMTKAFATEYYHWFFLIQKAPLPETLIGASAEFYLRGRCAARDGITEEAVAEYLRCYTPEAIHGNCEDYRAGATIDLGHAAEDGDRRVTCPLLVLWGEHSTVGRLYDVMAIWRTHAADVRGRALPGRHFLAEELPDATLQELHAFFAAP